LNLADAAAVKKAYASIKKSVTEKAGAEHFLGVTVQPMAKLDGYELILGSSIDPQFGPVLLFGLGGQLVEVFKDRALGIPPLTTTLARRMMEQTRIYTALKGVRGRDPVDLAALERLLVRFSQLIAEQRWIKELDINPLMASPEKLLALDARVLVYDQATTEDRLPKLAIRAYPTKYVGKWTARNNVEFTIRPILPEDESLLVDFHKTLSERTVFLRYLQPMMLQDRVMHERLSRICHSDYDREIALVVEGKNKDGQPTILGVGRLNKVHGTREGRFSVLISDAYQGIGMGGELLRRTVDVAKGEGLQAITAVVSADNQPMRKLFEKVGFQIGPGVNDKLLNARLDL